MEDYVKVFKALGQETRMKIIKVLAYSEMCVCELEEVLGMNQPRISQHLKVLREAGLVDERSDGPWRIYSLNLEQLNGILNSFVGFIETPLAEAPGFEAEAQRVSKIGPDLRAKKCKC